MPKGTFIIKKKGEKAEEHICHITRPAEETLWPYHFQKGRTKIKLLSESMLYAQ